MMPPFRFLVALALGVSICPAQALAPGSAPAGAVSQPAVSAEAPASAPDRPAAAVGASPAGSDATSSAYVLGSLDVVDIRVWNSPNLSGAFAIGPDGLLSLPLVGQLKADGLTIAELNKAITTKLSALINSPEVNVQLARNNSKKYYILGEVNRQGEFPLLGDMTVLDALANCGGFKDFANPKRIYVLRNNGKEKKNFNYKEVIQGKHMEQNIHLQNGDRILVP